MRRLLFMAVVFTCAALAIAGGAAVAAQTPYGNLGPPDSVATGTSVGQLLVDSTAACPGFASGNTLAFSITFHWQQRYWSDTPLGVPAWDEIDHMTGTATAGGLTYTLLGNFNSGISYAEDFNTSGKAKITRSDGLTLSGTATLLAVMPPVFPGVTLFWDETPRCK